MWLLSDLHALEVELWIHCFCTRHTPFKSSDCYQANLCLVWRFSTRTCFLATTFHSYVPRQIINVETWLNTVWNLDWPLEILCTNVSGYISVALLALSRGFCPGLFFTARVCSEPLIILHDQSVIQIFSGYFYGFLHHFIFCWVGLCCLWCSDPDLGHF